MGGGASLKGGGDEGGESVHQRKLNISTVVIMSLMKTYQ